MRFVTGLLIVVAVMPVHADEPSLDDIQLFEHHIRPVLSSRCYSCHGPSSTMSGLRLDSLEAMIKGGSRGPAIQPGDPDGSTLIRAISYRHEELQMPPNRPLEETQREKFIEWVRRGAIWPQAESTSNTSESGHYFTDEDRQWWAFQPLMKPEVPAVDHPEWSKHPIDAFIFRKLQMEGLTPAPPADKRTLVRRVYYDLIGLPPSAEEIEAFLADRSITAYEALVDRLLASPQYGERWARHWLDLVRYAESDGYKADSYRPDVWRYRDYVIDSFNRDKPYPQFVMEQLAGDEIAPNHPESMVAAHFLRLGIYEYNQRDARTQWSAILNELTDVTGDVFLGMGVSCARCHDHKFDPILQKDYYRLQAFFSPIALRNDIPLATAEEWTEYQNKLSAWKEQTKAIRDEIDAIEKPRYNKGAKAILETFPEDVKEMIAKPPFLRTPFERQLVALAEFQAIEKGNDAVSKISGEDRERLQELYRQLDRYESLKPAPLATVQTVTDISPIAPVTVIPGDEQQTAIEPGFLTILDPEPAEIERLPSAPNSTGRRTALARWITRPDNPLTVRVIVNRIWQYHMGRGIVSTASEFGRLGQPPSHPDVLDWLAVTFVENGWSFKTLHRLIVTSQTYRQTSRVLRPPDIATRNDPTNQWLWRMNARRLQAEEIRDTLLAVSNELDAARGGPSVDPSEPRRTIYTKVLRNSKDPLLELFDAPDGLTSTALRNATTTPIQSLLMLNGAWVYQRAKTVVDRLPMTDLDDPELIRRMYQKVLGRYPTPAELTDALVFVRQHEQEIERKYEIEKDRLIAAVQTLYRRSAPSSEREQAARYIEDQLKVITAAEVHDYSEKNKTVLAGGEGGPHAKHANGENSGNGSRLSDRSRDTVRYEAMVDLCHILVNSSEFLYVE